MHLYYRSTKCFKTVIISHLNTYNVEKVERKCQMKAK